MRKREEMLRDLHRRMDKYESDRRKKRAKMTKVFASVTPVCAAAVVGVGLWKLNVTDKSNNHIIGKIDDSTIIVTDNTHSEIISTNIYNETSSTNKSVQTTKTVTSVLISDSLNESKSEKATASENKSEHENNTTIDTTSVVSTKQPTCTVEKHTEVQVQPITTIDSDSDGYWNDGIGEENGGEGGDALGMVIIDGITYLQNFSDNTVYTPEEYLGNGGDFKGFYQGDTSISFYTAKENADIIIVMFYDGSQLNLLKTGG